jgi:two-component system response regulator NreC
VKAKLRILIVDDHHLMIEGYKSILSYHSEYSFEITTANNCEEAYKIITNTNINQFDVVFLDWILPHYEKENIQNGGDLVKYIQKYIPENKIVVLTSHVDAFTLYNIVKEINPSGILVKIDFTADDFLSALDCILADKIYYSQTVKQSIKNLNAREIYLDHYNRQIILLLSKGIKTKNLPDYLPLSISAIDKRKSIIKDYFLIEKGTDEDIIREARMWGLI